MASYHTASAVENSRDTRYRGSIAFRNMAIVGVHHVQLAMPPGGEAAARRFYSELLGIPEVPKPAELAKRGGAWFETAAVRVHLGVEADFGPARKAHPDLLVELLLQHHHRLQTLTRWPQARHPVRVPRTA